MRTCAHCGRSIAGKRANARFCSTSCRVMAGRKNPIPAVMRGSDRWVSWRPVQRGDKWSKLPTQVGGRPASSTDPRTWTSWSEVRDLPRRGWVLGEGIGCIDLDDCIDGDGVVAPWAVEIIREVGSDAILVEVSPSGRGVHVFAPMSPGRGRVVRERGRRVEIYPPDSGRYICVTGNRLVI